MSSPIRLLVLISGNGSNLQALIDACSTPLLPSTTIKKVISNKRAAYGLERARLANIPTAYHNLLPYKKRYPEDEARARQEYDAELARLVLDEGKDEEGKGVDLVVCAGWMHILSPTFLEPLAKANIPVINLHPALPGQYDGAHAIERAHRDFLEGKIEKTGVMIHYVIEEVDRGAVILEREVRLGEGDRELGRLEERIHGVEHEAIVEGTGLACEEVRRRRGV